MTDERETALTGDNFTCLTAMLAWCSSQSSCVVINYTATGVHWQPALKCCPNQRPHYSQVSSGTHQVVTTCDGQGQGREPIADEVRVGLVLQKQVCHLAGVLLTPKHNWACTLSPVEQCAVLSDNYFDFFFLFSLLTPSLVSPCRRSVDTKTQLNTHSQSSRTMCSAKW